MPSDASATALRRASPLIIRPALASGMRIAGTGVVAALMFLLASVAPSPASAVAQKTDGVCEQTLHASAAPPGQGEHSDAAPGSEGSTGWTGGTGGSDTGLMPQASTPASPDRQPEEVTGVNPTVEPRKEPC